MPVVMNSPPQSIRRRKAATGTADSLSAPVRSAGFFVVFTAIYQAFIGSGRRLTAAGRQAAGGPTRGFAAVMANTMPVSGVVSRGPGVGGLLIGAGVPPSAWTAIPNLGGTARPLVDAARATAVPNP